MRKLLIIILSFCLALPANGAIQVKEDGANKGYVQRFDFENGPVVTRTGIEAAIDFDGAFDSVYWRKTENDTGLTGDKTGTFDLTTTGEIHLNSNANDLKLGTGEEFTLQYDGTNAGIDVSSGILYMCSASAGNVEFFEGDVGNDDSGKIFKFHRKAPEGDSHLDFYLDSFGRALIEHYQIPGASDWQGLMIRSEGDLILQNTANGDIDCFSSSDIDNDTDGREFNLWRRAIEGDSNVGMYIDNAGSMQFVNTMSDAWATLNYVFDSSILIDSDTSKLYLGDTQDLEIYHDGSNGRIENLLGQLKINTTSLAFTSTNGDTFCSAEGAGKNWDMQSTGGAVSIGLLGGLNVPFRHYGVVDSSNKYTQFQVNDTDDYYWLTREDATINGFKIDMPVDLVDNNLTTTGTGTFGEIIDNGLSASTMIKTDGSKKLVSATAGTDYLTDIVQDTTPQLGGDLDGQAFDITTTGLGTFGTDTGSRGTGSFIVGDTNEASGEYSVSLGKLGESTGDYSVTMGIGCGADGYASFAGGSNSEATAPSSFAFGTSSKATGTNSFGVGGGQATSVGAFAVAGGTASGAYSTAFNNPATGNFSFVHGNTHGLTNGDYSVSFGQFQYYNTGMFNFAIGRAAIGGGSNSWVLTDSIFEIGIGLHPGARKNALTVRKNGNIEIPNDEAKLLFGTSQDASIYFNASDLIINSENITANDEVHFTNFDKVAFDSDISVTTGKKIYLDGGTDTYIVFNSSANDIEFYIDNTLAGAFSLD